MSGDAKQPSFKSDEELWAYIEQQEPLLNQLDDVFSDARNKPKPPEGLFDAPALFAEMVRLAREETRPLSSIFRWLTKRVTVLHEI
jgi:hypothetical protein